MMPRLVLYQDYLGVRHWLRQCSYALDDVGAKHWRSPIASGIFLLFFSLRYLG